MPSQRRCGRSSGNAVPDSPTDRIVARRPGRLRRWQRAARGFVLAALAAGALAVWRLVIPDDDPPPELGRAILEITRLGAVTAGAQVQSKHTRLTWTPRPDAAQRADFCACVSACTFAPPCGAIGVQS